MAFTATSRFLLPITKTKLPSFYSWESCAFMSGEWGSGAGKGGGSGGAVRDAGGIFGKMEAAREEEYFRKLQRKQLAKLKDHISEEISHHKRLIQQHKDAIARLEWRINEIKASETPKKLEN